MANDLFNPFSAQLRADAQRVGLVEAPATPEQGLAAIERVATRTRVPVNVLLAAPELETERNPVAAMRAIEENARRLAPFFADGADGLTARLTAATNDPAAAKAMTDRALEIGRRLYPDRFFEMVESPAQPQEMGALDRLGRAAGTGQAGMISSSQQLARDANAALERGALGRGIDWLNQRIGLDRPNAEQRAEAFNKPTEMAQAAEDYLRSQAEQGYEVANWRSIRGLKSALMFIGENTAASLPHMGAILATGGTASVWLGAAEANQELEERVPDMPLERRLAVAAGAGTLVGALDLVGIGGILGGVGAKQIASNAVSGRLAEVLVRRGVAGAAARTIQAGIIEGSTEVLQEGIVMAAVGLSGGSYTRDEVLDRLAQAGLAGAGAGAALRLPMEARYRPPGEGEDPPEAAPAEDARTPTPAPAPQPAPEPAAPPAQPAAAAPAAPPEPAPSAGPLSGALEQAPLRFPDLEQGEPVEIIDPTDGSITEGEFLTEDAAGVQVVIDNEVFTLDDDMFAAGLQVRSRFPGEPPAPAQAAPPAPAQPADPVPPSPQPPAEPVVPPPGAAPGYPPMDGAEFDAILGPEAPDITGKAYPEREDGDITRTDGKPFRNEAVTLQALRARGLDPAGHEVIEVTGGFVARPRPEGAAEIDAAASEADPAPTPGQAEAGNYRHGHTNVLGLNVAIETARGQERRGTAPDGTEWSVTMPAHYGRIKGTIGNDGDQLDIYIGPNPKSDLVVIVNQIDPETGAFDEHKIIAGTESVEAALDLYLAGFSDGSGAARLGSYSETDANGLREWIERAGSEKEPTAPIPPRPEPEDTTPAPPQQPDLDSMFDQVFEQEAGGQAVPDAVPFDAPRAKTTGPRTGTLPESQAYAALSQWLAEGRARTGGFARAPAGQAVTVSFGQWWGKNRVPKPEDKVFVTGDGADDAYYWNLSDFPAPEPRERLLPDGMPNPYPTLEPEPTPPALPPANTGTDAAMRDWSNTIIPGDGPSVDGDAGTTEVKAAFLNEAARYLGQVRKILEAEGWQRHLDDKGKPIPPVRRNPAGPAVSGEVSLTLLTPTGRSGIYVEVNTALATPSGGISMMARAASPQDRFGARSQNQWLPPDLKPSELAKQIADIARRAEPAPEPTPEPTPEPDPEPEPTPESEPEPEAAPEADDDYRQNEDADTTSGRRKKLEAAGAEIPPLRRTKAERYGQELEAEQATATMTIAQAFPEPDIPALVANGLPVRSAAALAMIRGDIGRKPSKTWQARDWAAEVDRARMVAARLIQGTMDAETAFEATSSSRSMSEDSAIETRLGIVASMPLDKMLVAGKYRILPNTSKRVGEGRDATYERNWIGIVAPRHAARYAITGVFKTVDDARTGILVDIALEEKKAERRREELDGGRKPVELAVRQWKRSRTHFIGFKVSGWVELRTFPTYSEAKAYLEANRADLLAEAELLRDGLNERRDTSRKRVGPKHRDGDVTPKMFLEETGFSVDFGKSQTGREDQDRLNDAWDAIHDLAGALGVPLKTLSLDGELKLSLGKRGRGGRHAGAAHYEPGMKIINLTRRTGAGSFAHEWWHAVDNYLAMEDAKAGGVSAAVTGDSASSRNEYATDRVRREGALPEAEWRALKDLKSTLHRSGNPWVKRAEKADNARSKPYFGTTIEMAARGFEKIVVDRLAARGMVNDFLANIDQLSGAYPTTQEARAYGVVKAFDAVLANIEARFAPKGGKMVELPPIDPSRLPGVPVVGATWEIAAGVSYEIKKISGETATVEVREEGKDARSVEMDLADAERMMLEAEGESSDTAKALRAAEKKAAESAAAAEKARREQKAAATQRYEGRAERLMEAFIEAKRRKPEGVRSNLGDRLYFDGRMEKYDGLTRAALVLAFMDEGYRVRGDHFLSPSGTLYKSMDTKLVRDFAAFVAEEGQKIAPDLDAMFDQLVEQETAPAAPTPLSPEEEARLFGGAAPEAPPPAQRTAGEAAASAAKNAGDAYNQAIDGLMALFGGKGTLSSGFTFDAERYKQAAPLFRAAAISAKASAADIMDVMRAIIRDLISKGMEPDQVRAMRPYVTRFADDVLSGKIALEEADGSRTDDAGAGAGSGDDALAGDVPGGGQGVPAGGAGSGGESQGGTDGIGNGRPDGNVRDDADPGVRPGGSGDAEPAAGEGVGPAGENPGNFVITDDFALVPATESQKVAANLAAIKLVQALDRENRYPTAEEQAALARYTGWGGLKTVFDANKSGASDFWGRAQAELKQLLGADDYTEALLSVRNAHYTSRTVVQAMWRGVKHFGFTGGRVLEPTIGTGNFVGMQPADIAAASQWHGAEMDPMTGRIARWLYPDAEILAGTSFQSAPYADGAFDLAIGNPPFGSNTITDTHPARSHLSGMKVHNYILAKTAMHLRPGGIMAMVITHRFLDTKEPEGRAELAKTMRFMGAIRLPNTAFKANAGTEVTTDIVFFQRLRAGESPDLNAAWLDTEGEIVVDGNAIRVNRYFAENPENILGRSAMDGTMYGSGQEYTVHDDGRDISASIDEVFRRGMKAEAGVFAASDRPLIDALDIPPSEELRVGGIALLDDGRLVYNRQIGSSARAAQEVVSPETIWKDGGEDWADVLAAAKALGRNPDPDAVAAFKAAAAPFYAQNKATGGQRKRANPPANVAAVYEIADQLVGDAPRGPSKAQIEVIAKKADERRLGRDNFNRLKGLMGLRNQAAALLSAERNGVISDAEIETMRADLKKAVDAFHKRFGYINDPENVGLLKGDIGIEVGLESDYKMATGTKSAGNFQPSSAEDSDILSRRVAFPRKVVDRADDADSALALSLSDRGRVDLGYIASLTGRTVREVRDDLANRSVPLILKNPATEEWEHAEQYLSGNVKRKLQEARDAGLAANIAALEEVQPADIPAERITPTLRSSWIPKEIFEEFLEALGAINPRVELYQGAGRTVVSAPNIRLTDLGQQFLNDDRNILDLMQSAMMGKAIVITRTVGSGENRTTVKDEEASRTATAMADRLAKTFTDWAYQSEARKERIAQAFNEKMNTHVERRYRGTDYLQMVGANEHIAQKLRRTQKDGAWRMIQSRSALLHHVVGAGKTWTVVAGIMERRRIGLSRKPMVAVPNHLVGQWANEWLEFYPGAKILAATPKDFEAKNRKALLARMATGDYDAIIIGHSSMGMIPSSPSAEREIITEQIADLQSALDEMRRNKESGRTVKQIADRIEKYREKIKKLATRRQDDIGITFQDLGVDYLAVDEAHLFKNLEYFSLGDRLVGMNDPNGSTRAFDLYVKVRNLLSDDRRDAGVTFATGTPVSNSLVEIFSMMKYLAFDQLKERGHHIFDNWAGAYVQSETRFEYTATQKLKERRVLSGMTNLRSLSQIYRAFADIILRDKLEEIYAEQIREQNAKDGGNRSERFPTPNVKAGGRVLLSAPATETQILVTDWLVSRMAAIKANRSDKEYRKIDNDLWVLTDARKSGIDPRTIDPTQPREPNSKVVRSAREIKRIYDRTAAVRGTQLVFSDLSTPVKTAKAEARKIVREGAQFVMKGEAKAWLEKQAATERDLVDQWAGVLEAASEILDSAETPEARRDEVQEWLDGLDRDIEATLLTADVGFSVYDDLKAVLVEQGVPEEEIAFIHDYPSDVAKRQLFEAVKDGRIRVLLGSTPKMGAGTNVQKRLVALHHLDAPWRPSDMEQREGRIIRAGNDLFAADPDGFEVEIIAYSTEGTSDVVMWQVLERKARAIEQFLNGSLDSMEEDSGDSDRYAEFMAQSTGNPVFRFKLEAEKEETQTWAEITGLEAAKQRAQNDLRFRPGEIARLREEVQALEAVSLDAEILKEAEAAWREAKAADEKVADAWEEKRAAVAKKREAAKAKGLPEEKWPKDPAKPPMTGFLSPVVQEKSKLARQAAVILRDLESSRVGEDQTITEAMEIPGLGRLEFSKTSFRAGAVAGIFDYAITLRTSGGAFMDLGRADSKSPVTNPRLQAALEPGRVARRLEEALEDKRQRADKMEADLPRITAAAEREIDKSPHQRARRDLAYFTAAQALAEAEADVARAKRLPNPFIDRDTRPLSSQGAEANFVEGPGDVVVDGEPLTLLGRGVPFGGDTDTYTRGVQRHVFPARRDSDGAHGLVKIDLNTDDKSWQPVEFMEEPARAAALRSEQEAATKQRRLAPGMRDALRRVGGKSPEQVSRMKNLLKARMEAVGLRGEVGLSIVDKLTSGGKEFLGSYNSTLALIEVSLNHGDPMMTLNHELIHALRDPSWGLEYGLFTKDEWDTLVRNAKRNGPVRRWVESNYQTFPTEIREEEMVAETYAEWYRDGEDPRTRAGALMRRISNALTAIRDWLNEIAGRKMVVRDRDEAARVMEAITSGAIVNRAREAAQRSLDAGADRPITLARVSRDEESAVSRIVDRATQAARGIKSAAGVAARSVPRLGTAAGRSAALTDAMVGSQDGQFSLLALVPGYPLLSELAKSMPSARVYQRFKDEMDALRNEWHARSDEVAQRWMWAAFRDRDSAAALADLMHESTIAGVDPERPFESILTNWDRRQIDRKTPGTPLSDYLDEKLRRDAARREAHGVLSKRFAALPEQFKKIYGEVRKEYAAMGDAFEKALIENIEKTMLAAEKDARRDYDREVQRIRDDGLKGAERDAAMEAARKKRSEAVGRIKASRTTRVAALRQKFETNKVRGPYFPLARFGSYWVTLRDEDGKVISFSKFESKREQEAFLASAEAKAAFSAEHGIESNEKSLRAQIAPEFMADIAKIVGEAGASDRVLDEMWQRYLSTLPDVSLRTRRIHRKGTPGYSQDALRAFSHHQFHAAHQLARLMYAVDLDQALKAMRQEARNVADKERAQAVVNEIAHRHEFTMNPKGGPVAQFFTQLAFVWYLGMTPAAAMVNLTQTTVVGPAMMGARFAKAGVSGAVAALGRASTDWARGRTFIQNSKRLSASERAAMEEGYRRGVIERTQGHDLAGIQDSGVEYSPVAQTVMRGISFFFHHAERTNREITFLASYRLARDEGMDHSEAIDAADQATYDVHFNYMNTARPRVMQGDVAKVVLTFRNFTVNMIYRLVRSVHQSMHGADPAARQEARRQLFGISASMFVHAGIRGVWGYGIIAGIIGLFFEGGDDDLERQMQRLLAGEDDETVLGRVRQTAAAVVLDGVPGALTGTALSERMGMPNLWFRGSDQMLDEREWYARMVLELLGPTASIGESLVRGTGAVIDGDIYRGIETAVPKFVRDGMRAVRYGTEGVTTWRGDPIVDDPHLREVLTQALGFTPARIAERYDANTRMKNREERIMADRRGILRDAGDALMAGRQIPPSVFSRIEVFNAEYPSYPIDVSAIRRSVQARNRASEANEFGIQLNPKLNARIRDEEAPTLYK